MTAHEKEELLDVLEDVKLTTIRDLVVFNDDFNTFDHVIETLVKVCKHSVEQAEQCAYIVHYKGQCVVKTGYLKTLKPMKEAIRDAGIDARIH